MDYSYILKTSKVLPEKLAEFGFEEKNGSYFCRKNILNGDFYSIIELKGNFLTAKVFESGSDERYVLFDVENANGSFVGEIRNQVRKIIELFRSQCCKTSDTKKKYVDFIQNKFGCKGDNPWSDTPENTVFRCKNKKWFALIIKIKFSRLGVSGDEEVFAVNLKANPKIIPEITDKITVFPAWHMNKKYWITVLLTEAADWEKLCTLTEQSFELVNSKN